MEGLGWWPDNVHGSLIEDHDIVNKKVSSLEEDMDYHNYGFRAAVKDLYSKGEDASKKIVALSKDIDSRIDSMKRTSK